jgi:hypothetical protein
LTQPARTQAACRSRADIDQHTPVRAPAHSSAEAGNEARRPLWVKRDDLTGFALGVYIGALWLLLQPGSRRWYGHVASEAARARHSGPWLAGTLAWALVCGLIQAAVSLFRL